MNETIIIKSVFIFLSLWAIALILFWFRPRIEIFWKIIATLILGFYVWFFFDDVMKGFHLFRANWYVSVIHFLKEFLTLVFINMFFIWPLALVLMFYKADDMGAERLLKFLCIATLVLWVIFIIYFYFNTGINKYLMENLKKMMPGIR